MWIGVVLGLVVLFAGGWWLFRVLSPATRVDRPPGRLDVRLRADASALEEGLRRAQGGLPQ